MLIGEKIKQLRKAKRLTLAELSDISGVQIATISRMENNKMSGTVESHMRLAKALGVEITDLYSNISPDKTEWQAAEDSHQPGVYVHSENSGYEILTKNILSKKMMPMLYRMKAGGTTHCEAIKAETEKFIFVLEGQLTVKIDEKAYILEKGHSLYFEAPVAHSFLNNGETETKFICVATPAAI